MDAETRRAGVGGIRPWTVAAAAVVLYAFLGLAPLGGDPPGDVLAGLYLIPLAALPIAAWGAMRRSTGKPRRLWRLLAIAGGAFFLADGGAQTYLAVVDPAGLPTPNVGDAVYVFAYLTLAPVVLLSSETSEVIGVRKVRHTLDVFMVVTWVFAVVFVLIVGPLSRRYGAPLGAVTVDLADFVAEVGLLLYLIAFKRARWRPQDLLLAGFLAMLALGDMGHVMAVMTGSAFPASEHIAVDLVFMAGFTLAAAAPATARLGDRRRVTGVPDRSIPRPEIDLPRWPSLVAHGLALTSVPLIIAALVRHGPGDPGRDVLAWTASILLGLLVARSAVVGYENRMLLERNMLDPLTGLANLRHYRERLAEAVGRAARYDEPVSLLLLDVDGLDDINAARGHGAGDTVLRGVADGLLSESRASSVPCRIGGDLFAVIMPAAGALDAFTFATRVQVVVAGLRPDGDSTPLEVTAGVAGFPAHAPDAAELDRAARGALYWAKRNMRGGIAVFDPDVVEVSGPAEHAAELEERSHLALVRALAAAVDARDRHTQDHSRSVAALAKGFAEHLGLDGRRCSLLESAALLHDVGKIGVPDSVLRKRGRLTDQEYARIKTHPDLAVHILRASAPDRIVAWIEAHHEWWDGDGYPKGVVGDAIPFESRLLCLCDSFDAMTSDRPYRLALAFDAAVAEVRRCAGSQFDPELVESFVEFVTAQRAGS